MNRLWVIALFSTGLAACQTTRVEEGPAGVYHVGHLAGELIKLPVDYRISSPARPGLIPADELKVESAFAVMDRGFSEQQVAGYLDRRDDGKVEIRLICRISSNGGWYRLPISGVHRVHPRAVPD